VSIIRSRRNQLPVPASKPIRLADRLEPYLVDSYDLNQAVGVAGQLAGAGARYILKGTTEGALAMQEDAHGQVDRSPLPMTEAAEVVAPLLGDGHAAIRAIGQAGYQTIADNYNRTLRQLSGGWE